MNNDSGGRVRRASEAHKNAKTYKTDEDDKVDVSKTMVRTAITIMVMRMISTKRVASGRRLISVTKLTRQVSMAIETHKNDNADQGD